MKLRHRSSSRAMWFSVLAACIGGCGEPAKPTPPRSTDPIVTFFEAFERGDDAGALAALPAAARDASPYDAATAALPISQRDTALYMRLSMALDALAPTSAARATAPSDLAVPFDLGVIAMRRADLEGARRKLLLCVSREPRFRMAHIYLARVYAELETAALATPEAKSAGAILGEQVGVGSSDTHIEMAQEIVEKTLPAAAPALDVSFAFDGGAIKNLATARTTASANTRQQRQAATRDPTSTYRVALIGPDHVLLDERWFAPRERLYVDGHDPSGMHDGGHTDSTKFEVSVQLLSPQPGSRVLVYDTKGTRLVEHPVP